MPSEVTFKRLRGWLLVGVALGLAASPAPAWADGKVFPPADYRGSLEERAQEAIIIFHGGEKPGEAVEDLILKISVEGDAREFAWVVPFPHEPQTAKEDAALFRELFDYVEARSVRPSHGGDTKSDAPAAKTAETKPVEVLSRKIVGAFDVAVVRENQPGALNDWLKRERYQPLLDGAAVIEFYRQKGYVFACVKVSDVELRKGQAVELHPLRFTFKTGGRDGIYFPMKMTGLQSAAFDVNLYVFYKAWLNDRLSKYGYEHRGFRRKYRDWDSPQCEANAGKSWSNPAGDPFLQGHAARIKTVAALMQKLHPGERYYLTNIQASKLKPDDVREWSDDLWLFPYYTDRKFVPFDARPGGAAAAAWPTALPDEGDTSVEDEETSATARIWPWTITAAASALVIAAGVFFAAKASRFGAGSTHDKHRG